MEEFRLTPAPTTLYILHSTCFPASVYVPRNCMKDLSREDQRHAEAAEGWIGLGEFTEARKELDQIDPQNSTHPAVLEIRWQLLAREKQWAPCLDIASTLAQMLPELPLGWVHRSYCLHELKRTTEARDNLLRVVDKFAEDVIMRYNLACYECQLGRMKEAKCWLRQAFALGDARKLRAMALDDSDLQPLWNEIADM
jgi:tetratricopeptide (TPR) repeat protein